MPLESHHHFQRKCLANKCYSYAGQWFTSYACCFREFYTGWLTHWGEKLAETSAEFTAAALEKILARNASAVLYVCSQIPTTVAIK